jgi:four helix bundle protein
MNGENKKYDLEERTARFGEEVIQLCKRIPKNSITIPIVSQLVRSGTSVGSNYCEADCAESRKDFEHKIGICKKEAKESRHWLRMLVIATVELEKEIKKLWQEAHELHLIFISIVKNSRKNGQTKQIINTQFNYQ